MPIKTTTELLQDITDRLANNNAGDISAADVRENIENIVTSILPIVTKELNSSRPFEQDIQIGVSTGEDCPTLTLMSGVYFRDNSFQNTAYPGPGSILHNDLGGLDVGDPHSTYLPSDGSRALTGSLELQQWINSSGVNDRGIKFTQDSSENETLNIAANTDVKFLSDNSTMSSSNGMALAYLNFGASGLDQTVTVRSALNINSIERDDPASLGKFKIKFKPGTLDSANFVAIGSSNGRSDSDNGEDFAHNVVATVDRGGEGTVLSNHYVTFFVNNNAGAYVDAAVNDLVIYGIASDVSVGTNVSSVQVPTPA